MTSSVSRRDGFAAALLAMAVGLSTPAPFAQAADGTPAISLPSLLEEMRRVNPELIAARRRWEAAQQRIPLAKGLPAPRIGVEWEEIPRGAVKVNQAMAMYSLIQALPFPGKLSLRHQVAVKEAGMAAMMFRQAEWEKAGMLKGAYYALFLTGREMEIQETQRGWLSQAATTAQARYATGTGSYPEVLKAQTALLEASNQIEVLAHRRQALAAHLNHLLNRPAHLPAGEPEPIPLLDVPSSPEDLWRRAQENQPELLAFKFSAERAEAAWRLSKRELLPDLETMLTLRDPAMGPIGPWDLSLVLALPFWFWTKQKYGVKAALFDKESADHAYQGAQNEIARRIHENWHQAKAAYATARLCREELIPKSEQAVSSSMAGYASGKSPLLELLEALQGLKERERTYVQHLVALEQQRVMLEQSVGLPLRPEHQPLTEEAKSP